MKKIITSVFLTFYGSFLYAQKPGQGLSAYSLKGKVKEVTEYFYRGKPGEADTLHPTNTHVIQLNEDGNVTAELQYTSVGALKEKAIYDYSIEHMMVVNYFNAKGDVTSQSVYKFDNDGREIEVITRSASGYRTRALFKHYHDGKIKEQDGYTKDDVPNGKILTSYNENGKLAEQDFVNSDGQLGVKHTILYDTLKNEVIENSLTIKTGVTVRQVRVDSAPDKNNNWQIRAIDITEHSPVNNDDRSISTTIRRKLVYY